MGVNGWMAWAGWPDASQRGDGVIDSRREAMLRSHPVVHSDHTAAGAVAPAPAIEIVVPLALFGAEATGA